MTQRFTRRRFVYRGATLAGAVGATTLVGGTRIAEVLAAAPARLSEAHRLTYAAIVEALALVKDTKVSAANVDGATAKFAAMYEDGVADFRTAVDNVLDRIEEAPGGDGFAALDRPARWKLLRKWSKDGKAGKDGIRYGVLATTAALYAAMPFHPNAIEDPRTVAVSI